MKIRVKGQYRFDQPGHTEQGIKQYDEIVEIENHLHKGHTLPKVAKILKEKDPTFDSIRTHIFEVVEDVKPTAEPVTADGEDSGAELFE